VARKYSQIQPTFWTGRTGRDLRSKGTTAQLLALYLLTSPHSNMAGIYYCPPAYIQTDTGLPMEAIDAAFEDLAAVGFAYRDTTTDEVLVINMVLFQVGQTIKPTDKRGGKVVENLLVTSSDDLKAKWLKAHGRDYESHGIGDGSPIDGAPVGHPPRTRATPEAETETKKQEQDAEAVVENLAGWRNGTGRS